MNLAATTVLYVHLRSSKIDSDLFLSAATHHFCQVALSTPSYRNRPQVQRGLMLSLYLVTLNDWEKFGINASSSDFLPSALKLVPYL